jgi:pterin-4a-carbinolamine dehydratase
LINTPRFPLFYPQWLNLRDIKPHLVKRFQFSTDKDFINKLQDVAGLYLDHPENAIAYRVDEKSQTHSLERAQPVLPPRPGLPEMQWQKLPA